MLQNSAYFRGKYFAERVSICDGHFWFWFLVGNLQNIDNFMENNYFRNKFWCVGKSNLLFINLKNDNLNQKTS